MNEEKIIITLYDAEGNEIPYEIERIFMPEGMNRLCAAAHPVDNEQVIFLYCEITEGGEDAELILADITEESEYQCVALSYKNILLEEELARAKEEMDEYADFLTVMSEDGKEEEFLIHMLFEDESARRTYAAVQKVKENGEILEEIYLYRFVSGGESSRLDAIPSDMEYERVRALFLSLIS